MSNCFTNQVIAQIELFTKTERVPDRRLHAAQAPGREGRPAAPGRARRQAHRAHQGAGRLPRRRRSTARTSRTTTATDIADAGLAAAGRARIRYAERAMPLLGRPARAVRSGPALRRARRRRLPARHGRDRDAGPAAAGGRRGRLAGRVQPAVHPGRHRRRARDRPRHRGLRPGRGRPARATTAHIEPALDSAAPDLVIDDGGDLVNTLHTRAAALLPEVRGGCESTTTGVIRLRRMAAEGALAFPVIAANDTAAKRMVDNTCGTGQSAHRRHPARHQHPAGRQDRGRGRVRAPAGRGVAERARGFGAQVDRHRDRPGPGAGRVAARASGCCRWPQAAPLGEVFVTATGSVDVINADHLAVMRDGAILANAGHFDVEIDVRALAGLAVAVHPDVRPHVDAYELGRRPDPAPAGRGPGGEPGRGRGASRPR